MAKCQPDPRCLSLSSVSLSVPSDSSSRWDPSHTVVGNSFPLPVRDSHGPPVWESRSLPMLDSLALPRRETPPLPTGAGLASSVPLRDTLAFPPYGTLSPSPGAGLSLRSLSVRARGFVTVPRCLRLLSPWRCSLFQQPYRKSVSCQSFLGKSSVTASSTSQHRPQPEDPGPRQETQR